MWQWWRMRRMSWWGWERIAAASDGEYTAMTNRTRMYCGTKFLLNQAITRLWSRLVERFQGNLVVESERLRNEKGRTGHTPPCHRRHPTACGGSRGIWRACENDILRAFPPII